MTFTPDLPYAEPSGMTLTLDLFRPDGDGPFPVVLCIHGGGWISGEKEGMHDIAAMFTKHGFAAACVQYRLAPLHPFPAAVEDVFAAITFLRAESESLNLDKGRFASFGNSAGGHLAAMAGVSKFADSRVQAVAAVCPITDLTDPHGQHFPVSLGFLEQFMGQPYEGNEELYRAASPLHLVQAGQPPFLLIHGEADDIVPFGQSVALAQVLQESGVPAELNLLPGEGHGLTWEAWAWTERAVVDFLKRTLA